jgi:hypothetical protein
VILSLVSTKVGCGPCKIIPNSIGTAGSGVCPSGVIWLSAVCICVGAHSPIVSLSRWFIIGLAIRLLAFSLRGVGGNEGSIKA